MNQHDDPPRLCERRDQANLAERIAGQAARDLTAAPLSSRALARIAARIDAANVVSRRPRRFRFAFVVAGLVLGIVTVASAAKLDLLPRWMSWIVPAKPGGDTHGPSTKPTKTRVRERKESSQPLAAQLPVEMSEPPRVEPLPEPAPVPAQPPRTTGPGRRPASPAQRPARDTVGPRESGWSDPTPLATAPASVPTNESLEPAAAVSPPAHSSPGTEPALLPSPTTIGSSRSVAPPVSSVALSSAPRPSARHLAEIVRALRLEHAPAQALLLLDRYADELANDAFVEESLLLRVEAMLSLGQRSAVLRLLDGKSLSNGTASRGLLAIRGELRAAANRCAEGIADFDLALAGAGKPSKQALLGRALCKERLGDTAGAQADRERYRRAFPDPTP